jgi:hypothetical protein
MSPPSKATAVVRQRCHALATDDDDRHLPEDVQTRPHHQRRCSVGMAPPRNPKDMVTSSSTSASLWGKEIPNEKGTSWGQFIDFDASY